MNLKSSLLAGAALFALAAQSTAGPVDKPGARKLLDPANLDKSVSPGQNFYLYANGSWLKNNPIPASQTRWGSFNELQENNYAALHTLLNEAAAKHAAAGTADQKVGDFYKSGMDSAAADKAGITPLKGDLDRIAGLKDAAGVLHEVAYEHTMGAGVLFSFGIGPDDKNVTKEICQFGQGGIGLPDRDYYFKTDARTAKIRTAYQAYQVKLFMLMGEDEATAKKDAADVFKLETALANASMTRVEQRDPYKTYNKFKIADINGTTPGVDWLGVFRDLKITNQDSCLVGQPLFFAAVANELKATPVEAWKKYLDFHLVNAMAGFLGSKFDQARFDFYGKALRGQQEQKPRWQRVLAVVDGSVGELLGKMYVDRNFKPEAKKRMLDLVNNLQQTYAERIMRLDWMSKGTKKLALIKLNTFMKKIGYTDKWKDYSSLTIGNVYVKNIMAASLFDYNYELSKLGKPVDKTVWGMTPPTVNAYYNPAFNEIVFPAGILQYPFFADNADDAVNYGGIGAVIGHEMTHGFDDQGRLYDAEGNLKNWWLPEDSANFVKRANMVVTQFNNYTILNDSTHVNGELTEGENLADLGGINIAYEAFQKTKQAKENVKIDGFTPAQRFFLSWAQVWRGNTRPEEIASRLMTDPHSPNELRCNGPVSNMPEFYAAFNIKPTDKMYRPEAIRAKVW